MSAGVSSSGAFLWAGGVGGVLHLWNPRSGSEIKTLTDPSAHLEGAVLSQNDSVFLTYPGDTLARLWDVASGAIRHTLRGHSGALKAAAFSIDGRTVATGGADSTARVWDVRTGRQLQVLGARAEVRGVAFGPRGHLLTAGSDGKIRVWDVTEGKELGALGPDEKIPAVGVAISSDGLAVAGAYSSGHVAIWDLSAPDSVKVLNLRASSGNDMTYARSVAFSPNQSQLLTGEFATLGAAAARLWSIQSGTVVQQFTGHSKLVIGATFAPDGRTVLGVAGSVFTWDAASGRRSREFGPGASSVFSSNGSLVVGAGPDSVVRVWSATSQEEVSVLSGIAAIATAAVFSLDAKSVVAGYADGVARVWDLGTKQVVRVLSGHRGPLNQVAASADGKLIATASSDSTAAVWDAVTGQQLFTIMKGQQVRAVQFSPDARFVLVGGGAGVALTNVQSRELVWKVETGGGVMDATFAPDGRSIATGGDLIAQLWDAASGKLVRTFTGHTHAVRSVSFSPDGRLLVTTAQDNTTRVWDTSSGEQVLLRLQLEGDDWVVVTPDGRFDGTESGMSRMHYARGLKTIGLEAFFDRFYTPGLTGLVLALGTSVPRVPSRYHGPDIRRGFGMPPSVRILAPKAGDTVQATITVAIEVKNEGGGAEDVRLYHNGALIATNPRGVRPTRTNCPTAAVCLEVELLPGPNTLEATAFSSAHIEAERSRVTVTVPGTRPTATLRVIAVGINNYQNPDYNLNYGRADAKAFVDSILAGSRGIFAAVAVDTLYDRAATGLAIKAAFRRVAVAAQPQDLFVFYYAGHGIAQAAGDSMRFFIVPTDVLQMSDAEQLIQRAVSNLQELFDAVPARKKLMVIDACQSGELLQGFAGSKRGGAEEQAIARLARASGIFVMSSAGSDQVASEVATLGHGVFTYAWLRAMSGDPTTPRERLVGAIASEVERMIPDLSRQYRARPQYPIVFRNGQDFPLVVR
jgi:WD40 repeat protein